MLDMSVRLSAGDRGHLCHLSGTACPVPKTFVGCRLLAASSRGPHEASMAEGAAHLLAKLTQGYPDESSSLHAATRLALALSASPGSRDRLIECGCVRCAPRQREAPSCGAAGMAHNTHAWEEPARPS